MYDDLHRLATTMPVCIVSVEAGCDSPAMSEENE